MRLNLQYIILISLLSLASFTSRAGKIDKAYKALVVKDYFKAKKHFTKALKYNESSAAQGLAIIYYRTDNPFHNYDSANVYIKRAINGWDMEKQRKKDKWLKFGFTEDSLFSFRLKISSEFYRIANDLKTEEALAIFISDHPWAVEKAQAVTTRDSIAFFGAVIQNNAKGYRTFVKKYPESRYAELARQNYHDSQYNEETADGTLGAYVEFINNNPSSPMINHAELNVFNISTASNTVDAFSTFINSYPENHYIDSAWHHLYQYQLMEYSIETMESFLTTPVPFKSRIEKDIKMFDSILFPHSKDSKFGFMNENGEVVIANDYEFTGVFQEGLAIIVLNGKYGFVNKHGEIQIPCKYESASDFHQGKAIVEVNEKMGMIDRNGRFFIDCNYDDLGTFSDSLVYASINDKYGYYDNTGKQVISHSFDDAYDFHNGIAKVEKDGKQSFINTLGEFQIPLIYSEVRPYYDTLYTFVDSGYYGIMNHKGQVFIEPIYSAIGTVNNGLAIASIQNRVVYIDTVGAMVIDNGYEEYPNYVLKGEFIEGRAIVSKKGKYGRINMKDATVTGIRFENIGIGTTQFPAQKNGEWGLFDNKDVMLIEPQYQSLIALGNGAFIASRRDTVGVVNQEGEVIVPFSFSNVESIGDDLFLVSQNETLGVYKNEKLIIPLQFNQIGFFNEDFLFLIKDGALLYYNIEKGKLVQLSDS